MNVDRGAYRFRILDGSTARFYNLSFPNGMPFTVIGTEGGYLKTAAPVTSILIAPGERFDIIADFSAVAPGTKVTLLNSASTPYPPGAPRIRRRPDRSCSSGWWRRPGTPKLDRHARPCRLRDPNLPTRRDAPP